ncbi:MAG TPA: tRNA (adenosine(37)-N6)-threonylcarbamoyltransferase complex transferase subunit TsaD [Rhizomicrobium sp.]|nr:tRNA (adenosine(37)-N6)-threonylcarbamoyltransferase complex transferase subunit TsaD [Rhizomicrobium sp.]
MRAFHVLGIETSCDETAAAVVRGRAPGPGEILSNVVLSQLEEHAPFGGVVPEIAARAHVEALDTIIETALDKAQVEPATLDAVAATAGPGLIGGVMVGLTTAKALALAWDKPLIAVNHLEAHALTARMTEGIQFPYLLLLISGGHCQLLAVEGVGQFRLYGTTIDDAAGEAFDKVAKLLELPYPGGPKIEALATQGSPKAFALPRPMVGREGADFSFSGLKTAVRQIVRQRGFADASRADLAASFQAAVVESLTDRVGHALAMFCADFPNVESPALVVAGGVAANAAIGATLAKTAAAEGFQTKIPPPKLCTDNAAMIAWAGVERSQLGLFDGLGTGPKARWPLSHAPVGGSRTSGAPGKPDQP